MRHQSAMGSFGGFFGDSFEYSIIVRTHRWIAAADCTRAGSANNSSDSVGTSICRSFFLLPRTNLRHNNSASTPPQHHLW